MGFQELVIDARPIVVAVQGRNRSELAEVPIAFQVTGKQEKVKRVLFFAASLVRVAAGGDVGFHADEGLDPLLLALHEELHDPEHDAMVGYGKGGHVELFGSADHIRNPVGPIEQAVLGVVMNVAKLATHGGGKRARGPALIVTEPGRGLLLRKSLTLSETTCRETMNFLSLVACRV